MKFKTMNMKFKTILGIFSAVCLSVGTFSFSQERTWTDKSGKYKVEASFIRIVDGQLKLKRLDTGKEISVPLSRLSDQDQAAATNMMAELNSSNDRSTKSKTGLKLKAEVQLSNFTDIGNDKKNKVPNIELLVTATGKEAQDAIEIGFLKLTEIVDNGGGKLQVRKPRSDFFDKSKKYEKIGERGDDFFNRHPLDGVRCTFEIVRSAKKTTSLMQVKGSFKIRTGGKREVIKIEKTISNLGKVKSSRLSALGIEADIKRPNTDSLEIKLTGKDLTAAYWVAVLDPNGKKLKAQNGSSWGGYNKSMSYTYSFNRAIPADATVFIFLASGTIEKDIPFQFSNLKIPEKNRFGF